MSPRTELTLLNIGARKCEISETKIAECLNRAPSTIHKVIVAYCDFGQEKPPLGPGRPKIITSRDSCAVKKVLQKNRRTNIKEIRENLISSTSTIVSESTLHFHLHEIGFYGQVGVRKPLVTEKNGIKRLDWAKRRL